MTDELRRPIFAVFQGGGAKGVAHVGALEAVAANKLEIIGAAGTSAGALIATLVAIGYEARDILDPDDGGNILNTVGATPLSVLGERDWQALLDLGRGGRRVGKAMLLGGLPLGAIAGPRAMMQLVKAYRRRGLLDPRRIQDVVEQIVSARLDLILKTAGKPPRESGPVRFRHLDPKLPSIVALKVVATDIDGSRLMVFDRNSTPDVVVAEAVAASVAIPFIFQPAKIPSADSDSEFADGGLVANLPISVFTEEKLSYERAHPSDPPVPILGFTLKEPSPPKGSWTRPVRKRDALSYLQRIVGTALAGSQSVTATLMEDVVLIPLETQMGLLGFDSSWEAFRQAYLDGKASAQSALSAALQTRPDRVQAELRRVYYRVIDHLNDRRRADRLPLVGRLRTRLVEPFGRRSLRVTHAFGLGGDADGRLLLDSNGLGPAEAFRARDVVRRTYPLDPRNASDDLMTKYERALVRPTIRSMLAIPVFSDIDSWTLFPAARLVPAGVICFDSDEDLDEAFGDETLLRVLVRESALLYPAL